MIKNEVRVSQSSWRQTEAKLDSNPSSSLASCRINPNPYEENLTDPEKLIHAPIELSLSVLDSAYLSPEIVHIYPEGGFRAWLVVLGSFCAMFASLGIANSLASFQAYISENQLSSHSPGQIGWIFSIYTFLSFACGIYIGPLFDVYGPRWLLLPGSVCVVASMMLLGLCTSK